MKTDVSGTEAFFKAIVAGDPTNGCYKGQDFVSFRPFCKMVFSSNRMITARDVDFSFMRRICFIDFPIRFVDGEPTGDNQKKKDTLITQRILNELPGIFNWAVIGLKELRANGRFTETCDQKIRSHELESLANPLVSFCEDVVGNGAPHWAMIHSRKEIYKEYKKWCEETGTNQMSARAFWPRLRSVYPFHDSWSNGERMILFEKKVYKPNEAN